MAEHFEERAERLLQVLPAMETALLQVIAHGLVELGLHGVANTVRPKVERSVGMALLGFVLLGALVGGLSLLLFPSLLLAKGFAVANLLVTPVLAGFAMCLVGRWRTRRGDAKLRIDTFGYSYVFALAVALTRFVAA